MTSSREKEEGPLTVQELEARARRAVDELEQSIDRLNGTRSSVDEARHAHLLSLYMSLLAEKFGVVPPDFANIDEPPNISS